MTQDERWVLKYQEVKGFILENKRNPSRYNPEERYKYCNWIKHNKKLMKAGELNEERVESFKELLSKMEKYKRLNQYK